MAPRSGVAPSRGSSVKAPISRSSREESVEMPTLPPFLLWPLAFASVLPLLPFHPALAIWQLEASAPSTWRALQRDWATRQLPKFFKASHQRRRSTRSSWTETNYQKSLPPRPVVPTASRLVSQQRVCWHHSRYWITSTCHQMSSPQLALAIWRLRRLSNSSIWPATSSRPSQPVLCRVSFTF